MALNYVSLTLDLFDGQGSTPAAGTATFTPTVQLTDTTDHEVITQAPVTASFKGTAPPVVQLLATDNGGPAPPGWGWTVTFSGVPGNPAGWTFFLPFSAGSSQRLSDRAPVSSAVTMQSYLPLPSGTAAAGNVPVATGSGNNSAWQPGLYVLATTGVAGYTEVNGTGTILSFTFPNDGLTHRVLPSGVLVVATTQTGGQLQLTYNTPDGVARTSQIDAGGHVAGTYALNNSSYTCAPGSTATIRQNSALTAGAAVVYPELWGS